MELSDIKLAHKRLFATLLTDPEKKAKVLELLTQEGLVSANENFSPNSPLKRSKCDSPLKKLHDMITSSPRPRTKKIESPSALGRRRALQQLNSSLESSQDKIPDRMIRRPSNAPELPYHEVLKGLIIFCEVRSNGEDRSSSIKTMVRALGATVRDYITRDVTHVIFKDGLYSTFRKAQNMKMHIVSVLWLDAVRRYKCRMPEEKYKPLDFDKYNKMNEAQVCQEIEEEFNDVLTDELRRSAEKNPQFKSHFDRQHSVGSISCNDSQEHNNVDEVDDDISNRPGYITPLNRSSRSTSKCSTPTVSKTNLNTSQNNNKDLLVPCSQNDSHSFTHTRKSTNLSRVVEETFDEDSVSPNPTPKPSNLAKHVRDSFELKKVQKLKSPPHELAAEKSIQSKRSSASKISLTDDESMNLHLTTTTDQSLNNSRKRRSTASSNFAQKLLTSDLTSNNTNNRVSNSSNARTSTSSTDLLNGPLNGNITNTNKSRRRTTIGLSRSKKSSVSSLEENAPKQGLDENVNQETDNFLNNVETLLNNEVTEQPVNGLTTTAKKTKGRKLFRGDYIDESLFNWDKAADFPPIEPCITPPKKRKVELPANFPKNLSSKARKKVSTVKKSTAKKANVNTNNPAKVTLAKILQFGENEKEVEKGAGDNINSTKVTSASESKNEATSIPGIQAIEDSSKENITKPKRTQRKTINAKKLKSPISTEDNDTDNSAIPIVTDKRPKRNSVAPVDYKKMANFTDDSADDQPATKSPVDNGKDNSEIPITTNKRQKRKSTVPIDYKKMSTFTDDSENDEPATKKPDRHSNMTNGEKTDDSYKTANSELSSVEKPKGRKSKRLTISTIASDNSEDENFTPSPKNKKRKSHHTISSISSGDSEDDQSPKTQIPKNTPAKSTRKSVVKNTPISKAKVTPIRSTRRTSVMKEINSPVTPNNRKKPPPKTPQTKNKNITKIQNLEKTPNRRSTMEFLPRSSRKSLARMKAAESPKPVPVKTSSIVCTRFHRADSQVFAQIVSKLGGFVVEDEVTKRTTHLVCGGAIRTINLLRAIARGCWILKREWLYKSLEAGRWLEEEDYEMVEFSPAIQKCRLEKQAFGPLYSMDLFKDCGQIFISRGSIPRCSDLEELVQLCGGRTVRIIRDADIIVGEKSRNDKNNSVCVTEKWILDSITDNKKKNFKNYEITG